ncbi:MAG: response regulator [Bacteroidota bacterium]|jgi:CheY-like chemotaxis protein
MEQTENMTTETLSIAAEAQCQVNEPKASETQRTQAEDTHQAERAQMMAAAHNLPHFDIQMARQHPLRILLAEDSLVNIKIVLWFLRKLGYHADVAFNGIEVIDALKRRSYDVILMDAEMPEMDGRQATMLIRKDFPSDQQPNIIAMTANAQTGDREEFLFIGMNDYITKPIKMEDMIRVLLASKPTPEIIEIDSEQTQTIRMVA